MSCTTEPRKELGLVADSEVKEANNLHTKLENLRLDDGIEDMII